MLIIFSIWVFPSICYLLLRMIKHRKRISDFAKENNWNYFNLLMRFLFLWIPTAPLSLVDSWEQYGDFANKAEFEAMDIVLATASWMISPLIVIVEIIKLIYSLKIRLFLFGEDLI